MRNPSSLCWIFCFVFNTLHKAAPMGAAAFPLLHLPLFRSIFIGSDFKGRLCYLWKCCSLVIHWKVSYLCGARKGLKLAELCQARFGYQRLITSENRWGWLRWEVLALFWGTSEQEFQEHWLFVLLWCKKSDDGSSLMSASHDVVPTWRCSLHPTLSLCFE